VGAPIAEKICLAHRSDPDPDRRLRVGYISSDFRRHSAARCFRPMLRSHDKAQFEITCYSTSAVEDDFTEEFQKLADRWRNVVQLSDDELCGHIQADQIDILVDLSGHTAGNRLTVFARKPSPVQVSAGATGTGIPRVDYLFSDAVACPPAVRHLFAEKIFDLPSIMTIEPLPYQIPLTKPPVLSRRYVTFGVFNRVSKISNEAVSLWSRILEAVPQSRLLIKDTAVDEATMRVRQLERFAAHGTSSERIAFLGATPHQDHLAAFKGVDISLDPFPQNGGISALESLQMGVPLVTLLGNGISSRAAGSILSSVGMNAWVAETPDDYLAIAVKFASMPDHLEALRPALPGRVARSAVGDAAIYTKAIETAYRTMWAEYCRTAGR
jgi:predicted O-linked N-acetylglucosamine transferase (SPINDLY family)